MQHDPINNPSHYTDGGYETIDFIEKMQLGYHLGNVVKYISRAGKKSTDPIEDLKKAMWYLERQLRNEPYPKTIMSYYRIDESDAYCVAKGITERLYACVIMSVCVNDLRKAHEKLSIILQNLHPF